jgi:hypothetical protein
MKSIYYSDLKPFSFKYETLHQITCFYWTCEYVFRHFISDEYTVQVIQDRPGYGAHWGGFCLWLKNNEETVKVFIHAGLVHNPSAEMYGDTETGIYCETESWNNVKLYQAIRNNLAESDEYHLNKDQSDFTKMFFPLEKLDRLMNAADVAQQHKMLITYYDACFKGILAAIAK